MACGSHVGWADVNAVEEAASASAVAEWDEHHLSERQSGADGHESLVCYCGHYYDDSLCCSHTWDLHGFCGLQSQKK